MVIQRFGLRPGTGGLGRYDGGDGVTRELLFRKALTLSVLTERRVHQPYGLKGNHYQILFSLFVCSWINFEIFINLCICH